MIIVTLSNSWMRRRYRTEVPALRAALLDGALPDVTCLLGTMVQEGYETHPAIRDACRRGIEGHDEIGHELF